ncbi:zinc finger protein 789-like [Vombatus ursinus]|uniref:zinc finger protein 789-like n=1 Tax=Vombatus ursinus TaxID=29139 RepID=UPI000FFDAA1E|nr:zinc finger protein 789-like [Vombatus ursinus]
MVTFEGVTVYLTQKEWGSLKPAQRDLCKDVMIENYGNLVFLGFLLPKPDEVEEPWVQDMQGPEERESSRDAYRGPKNRSDDENLTPSQEVSENVKLHGKVSENFPKDVSHVPSLEIFDHEGNIEMRNTREQNQSILQQGSSQQVEGFQEKISRRKAVNVKNLTETSLGSLASLCIRGFL